MKIALTGANGALGKVFMSMYPDTLPVKVRYKNYTALETALSSVDVLIHAGAIVPNAVITDFGDNYEISKDVLSIAAGLPVLVVSSMSILDKTGAIKNVDQMTEYAKSKYNVEMEVHKYKNASIARFSTLFYKSPGRDGLSKLIHTAKTQGVVSVRPCIRDFLPLQAACSLLRGACESQGIFNLGTGLQTNLLDVANYLSRKYATRVFVRKEAETEDVYSSFPSPAGYGLPDPKVDIYRDIDDYYQSIGDVECQN